MIIGKMRKVWSKSGCESIRWEDEN